MNSDDKQFLLDNMFGLRNHELTLTGFEINYLIANISRQDKFSQRDHSILAKLMDCKIKAEE